MIDVEFLKAGIAARAPDFIRELFGDQAKLAGTGTWRVGSHGSLAVEIKDGALVFFSHEDGNGGDAVALWQRIRGGDAGDALKACATWAGVGCGPAALPPPPTAAKTVSKASSGALPYALTDGEAREGQEMARRLADDEALCARIARWRGWKAETVQRLAMEAYLGWQNGRLAFLYDTGVKCRWRGEQGERVIRWHFGKPWVWRGALLRLPGLRRVFVTEGETDAIRLLDAGLDKDGFTLVVALPSASTFAPEWAGRFSGMDVTLALDNDEAGRKATARVGALLRPVAHSVRILDWKGVTHAAS